MENDSYICNVTLMVDARFNNPAITYLTRSCKCREYSCRVCRNRALPFNDSVDVETAFSELVA